MVSKLALLPVINRNLPSAIDHNGFGLVAYACRNCIYVMDLKVSPPVVVDSKVIRFAHKSKIESLSFCKSEKNILLATVGEDSTLKIWDLETASLITSLVIQEVTANIVEWLYDSTNSVVFADKSGIVSKWNFRINNLVRMKTGSESVVTFISSNSICPELLAVGHFAGTISILNVHKQTCLKRFRTHSMEITSLCWSTLSPSTLLSSSMDQSARVWNLDEDNPVKTFYYPRFIKFEDRKNVKNFRICSLFHPENPDMIICSNVRGNLAAVEFKGSQAKYTSFSTRDFEGNFKTVCRILPYINANDEKRPILLTADHLKLGLWDILDQKLLTPVYFTSGSIFDFSPSPVNPNLLAICCGDGFIKLWNTQCPEMNITSVYIHPRIKITCVAWHPTQENIIAYGTDEGRVGVADTTKKRFIYTYEKPHTGTVYSLQCAPCKKIDVTGEKLYLYSCGGFTVYIHEWDKPKEPPINFDELVKLPSDLENVERKYSELSWKSDYSCLALGNIKGFVDLYDGNLDFLVRLDLQVKSVESIKWHPLHTYSSHNKESEYSSWLAMAGNDNNIHIFDAAQAKRQSELVYSNVTKTLTGHKKRVSILCWSLHNDGYLASGSRDGTVQVWNAITATPIVNYSCHKDFVYAIQWSVFDPDVIYSGGLDNCLRIWNISDHVNNVLPESACVKHKPLKPRVSRYVPAEESQSEPGNSSTNVMSESPTDFSEDENSRTNKMAFKAKERATGPVSLLKIKPDLTYKEKQLAKSLFRTKNLSKEENFQNLLKLVDILSKESDNSDCENSNQMEDITTPEELMSLGLFTDQRTALKMIESKAKIEREAGLKERANYLQLMAGDAKQFLRDAAEKKELTDFLVSASPTVSHKFWCEICEKYAMQLVEEQLYIKASMYLMLCGKLNDAIKLLFDKGRLVEALGLAKARLPEANTLINSILHKLSFEYAFSKQPEKEALCLLAINDPARAAKILISASGDSKYAYGSAYICSKLNLKEEAETYGYTCVEKCLSQNDWATFYKVAEIVESVKIYSLVVRVHEIIATQLKTLKKEEGLVNNDLFGVTGSKILIWNGKRVGNSNISFLDHIYHVLKLEGIVPEDNESLQKIHKALDYMETTTKVLEKSAEAHVKVAIYVSQGIVTSLLGDSVSATKYFINILPTTCNVVFMPKIICWLFLPFEVYWSSNTNVMLCEISQMYAGQLLFASQFEAIFNSVCSLFGAIVQFDSKACTIYPDISSNFDVIVQQVLAILSRKTTEDSLLLYFSASYLNELRMVAKRGWRFRCYNKAICDKTPKNIEYKYNLETKSWDSDTHSSEDSVSMEDALKAVEKNKFQLPEECMTEDDSLNFRSITGVILHVFSPEIDPDVKNGLVERYGFKDVSDFLLQILSDPKPTTNGESQKENENEENTDELDSSANAHNNQNVAENIDNQVMELDTFCSEDDFHLQCWTDVSLYYVVTKSFISAVCRDEYALLYYLQNYLQELDVKIADLARQSAMEQSRINSNKESKPSKSSSNCKEKNKHVQENKKCQDNSIENSKDSDLLKSEDTKVPIVENVSDSNILLNASPGLENKVYTTKSNEELNLENEVNMDNSDEKLNLENEVNIEIAKDKVSLKNEVNMDNTDEKLKLEDPDNIDISNEKLNLEDEINVDNAGEKLNLENEVNIDNLDKKANLKSVLSTNGADEKLNLEDEINMNNAFKKLNLENEASLVNVIDVKKALMEDSDDLPVESDPSKSECVSDITNSTNELVDKEINLNNKIDENVEAQFESGVNLINENSGNLKLSNEGHPDADGCDSVNTDKIENCSRVLEEIQLTIVELNAQREKIIEGLKLLQLEEFWYPNPFITVDAIRGICRDIFNKNPCELVKEKFHELAHEVDQWSSKYCFPGSSVICKICENKISA